MVDGNIKLDPQMPAEIGNESGLFQWYSHWLNDVLMQY